MLKQWAVKIYTYKYPAWVAFLTNVLLLVLIVLMNNAGQHFCIPVLWFTLFLGIIAAGFCAYPLLRSHSLLQKTALLMSSLWGWVVAFALIFSLKGLVDDQMAGVIPLYIVYMFTIPLLVLFITLRRLKKHFQVLKRPLLYSHLLLFSVLAFSMMKYRQVLLSMESVPTKKYESIRDSNPIDAYMLERITGMHFIYHTRLCVYDGWRPPLLDPILSLGFILYGEPANSITNEFKNPSPTRENGPQLYKRLFPNKPVVQKCSCPGAPSNYFEDLKSYR